MTFKQVVAIIFWLAVVAAPVVFAGSNLLADTANGPNWMPAPDLEVSKAECTRWQGIVSTCSIKYIGNSRSEIEPELNYFVYGSWAKEHAVLLRSTKDPTVISTVQAVRDLGARQVTLTAWLAIWLASITWVVVATIHKAGAGNRPDVAPKRQAEFPSAPPAGPSFASAASATAPQLPGGAPTFGRRGR